MVAKARLALRRAHAPGVDVATQEQDHPGFRRPAEVEGKGFAGGQRRQDVGHIKVQHGARLGQVAPLGNLVDQGFAGRAAPGVGVGHRHARLAGRVRGQVQSILGWGAGFADGQGAVQHDDAQRGVGDQRGQPFGKVTGHAVHDHRPLCRMVQRVVDQPFSHLHRAFLDPERQQAVAPGKEGGFGCVHGQRQMPAPGQQDRFLARENAHHGPRDRAQLDWLGKADGGGGGKGCGQGAATEKGADQPVLTPHGVQKARNARRIAKVRAGPAGQPVVAHL